MTGAGRNIRGQVNDADRLGRDPAMRWIVKRMKLGTVHRLQGAERPLVLFSATNTPDDGGHPFMDSNRDMLNVAVSRAQDHFILFGHPVTFSFLGRRRSRATSCRVRCWADT